MAVKIEIFENKKSKNLSPCRWTEYFTQQCSNETILFHNGIPAYKPTPLVEYNELARTLNVKKIWIKDESFRLGLNAFKVLGASFAASKYLLKYIFPNNDLSFSFLTSEPVKKELEKITLVTATDGNHGRGVAWTAEQLGCKCRVFMPRGSSINRLNNIKSHGAYAEIIDGSYDQAVIMAKEYARNTGCILVQDTSWNGYEEIPLWIMQGYLTLMKEIFDGQLSEMPTHIFVQSGVGSLPAAAAEYLFNISERGNIIFSVVEPDDAACCFESALENKIVTLTNNMHTIMAGLACGTPGKLAWEIMKNRADFFIKCSDDVTVKGMRLLAGTGNSDPAIISGESGAVTAGLVYYLRTGFPDLCGQLQINENSKILLISTEGNTDPVSYKNLTR